MADDSIRTAHGGDVDSVAAVLTASFQDDPVMSWAWPDPHVRTRRLHGLWTFMAGAAYVPRGTSTVVPGGDGAALWAGPGDLPDEEFWVTNAGRFVELLGGDIGRLGLLSDQMDANHPHDREHWYLMAIGVSPAAQGRRLGSALLAHTLAIADDSGAPAYLEATSTRSRALYERVGFEVIGQIDVPGGPPMWPMWREPGVARPG